jgi:mannose-6-phosphate isomerase
MTDLHQAEDGPGLGKVRVTPFRLRPMFAPRIWGRMSLEPWYAETGFNEKVGEAWLTGPESVVDSGPHAGKTLGEMAKEFPGQLGNGEFPLLVKMLFPSDKLSVQVHPNDAEAQKLGLARGKSECWYVLEADVGATVACGFKSGVSIGDVVATIADGTVESLLHCISAEPGDMIFVDAGTVHGIGPGLVLLEVQQSCDVTYRLFDYGRPRELHVDDALAVIKLRTDSGKVKPKTMSGFTRLIETKYFVVDLFELSPGKTFEMPMDNVGCVAALKGRAAVNEVEFSAGQAVVLPYGSVAMSSRDGATLVRCWEPE